MLKSSKMKLYTLEELKNELIGIEGSNERNEYEQELALEYLKDIEFWKQLKKELGKGEYFCHTSDLFRELWDSVKGFDNEIIELASEFLKGWEEYKDVYSSDVVLFGNLEELSYNKIRVQFCDYMINKLKDGTTV
jgi:diadenosine tetraphosphatase ApaH/serine/threonine PP2A family protein phosphatase